MKTRLLLCFACFFTFSLQGQTARMLSGYVVDQSDQGLENKKVEARFYDCNDDTFQEIVVETFSDADGYYELEFSICDNEGITIIAYCDENFQSVDGISFSNGNVVIDFTFDCNFDFNCEASFAYTWTEPENLDDGIPIVFKSVNPTNENYFYEFAFLGALDDDGGAILNDEDSLNVIYPTFGQYTVCMQTYIAPDPFTVICEYCESINADLIRSTFTIATNTSENFSISNNIKVSPNPTQDEVLLDFTLSQNESLNIEISNLIGQTIYQENFQLSQGDHQLTFDLNDYNSGIYWVTLNTSNGRVAKTIIKH